MSELTATIFNIQKFSTEDGPGIRTTVFFKGCPMRCPWCHNPESQRFEPEVVWHGGRCLADHGCIETCPEQALQAGPSGIVIDRDRCTGCGACVDYCPASALEMHGERVAVEALFDRVVRDATFYDQSGGGVTLSGGEPLAQPKAAVALLWLLKDAGIHTALDTCGAANENALREALECVDLVLFDVKTVDPERHEAWTGVPFEHVDAAARMVNDAGVPVWVRTPVIPGYNSDEITIRALATYVNERFGHCQRHDLLAYSNLCVSKYEQLGRPFVLAGVPLLTREALERLCDVARSAGSPYAQWSGPTQIDEARRQNEG